MVTALLKTAYRREKEDGRYYDDNIGIRLFGLYRLR